MPNHTTLLLQCTVATRHRPPLDEHGDSLLGMWLHMCGTKPRQQKKTLPGFRWVYGLYPPVVCGLWSPSRRPSQPGARWRTAPPERERGTKKTPQSPFPPTHPRRAFGKRPQSGIFFGLLHSTFGMGGELFFFDARHTKFFT